jgi:hypothetical protein
LEEHVQAICSIGENTKAAIQGYIGEKGIGFKSVFKIAKKAHVQSGPFSFSFEHIRDSSNDGLGMVTPLDDDYEDLPNNVNTRITLTLLDASTFDQCKQELLNIPDTLLLFLPKPNSLHVNIQAQAESATKIKYTQFPADDSDSNQEMIEKITNIAGHSTEDRKHYFVVRKEIRNLPHVAARINIDTATVILAFPVDEEDKSIIEQQHVFAFLPLRPAGFIVCSSFLGL